MSLSKMLFLLTSTLILGGNCASFAASEIPEFEFGEDYGVVRQKMQAAGWSPLVKPGSDECQQDDQRCQGRPEMESCSGSGLAMCRFNWSKGNKVASICTHGEQMAMFNNICDYSNVSEPTANLANQAGSYEAVISCGMNGQNINVLVCFKDTDLKITKDGKSVVYKIYNLQSAGKTYKDGLHIDLPERFSIKAQNSEEHLVLGVTVTNKSGETVFQDQAGKWDVIFVSN